MLIASWWFIALLVNCGFYDLIRNASSDKNMKTADRSTLIAGLTVIDIVLIIALFD